MELLPIKGIAVSGGQYRQIIGWHVLATMFAERYVFLVLSVCDVTQNALSVQFLMYTAQQRRVTEQKEWPVSSVLVASVVTELLPIK